VHQQGAGALKKAGAQAIGRPRGGSTTKIRALVEGLGNPSPAGVSPPDKRPM